MAAQPRQIYETHKEAVAMYEDIKSKLDAGKLVSGQVLNYYTEYQKAILDYNVIVDIIKDLLATASLGFEQQAEPVNNAVQQFVITNNPSAPFGGDHISKIQASYDLVALYEECIKVFSNKITPVKSGQKFAFQNKYQYAFDQGLPCDDIITTIASNYNDQGLTCSNQGNFYQMV